MATVEGATFWDKSEFLQLWKQISPRRIGSLDSSIAYRFLDDVERRKIFMDLCKAFPTVGAGGVTDEILRVPHPTSSHSLLIALNDESGFKV
jgi:hypothetical protein